MKISKSTNIEVTPQDDFLYVNLLTLLEQIKLVQGGTSLDATLRRHQDIKLYMIQKQIEKIKYIEEKYFNPDGSLNHFAIQNYNQVSQNS